MLHSCITGRKNHKTMQGTIKPPNPSHYQHEDTLQHAKEYAFQGVSLEQVLYKFALTITEHAEHFQLCDPIKIRVNQELAAFSLRKACARIN